MEYIRNKNKGGTPIKNINNDTLPKAMNSKTIGRITLPFVIVFMAMCVVMAVLFTVAIFSDGIQEILLKIQI